MIIDVTKLQEISINGKKFFMDPNAMKRLVTSNVDERFTEIHEYTISSESLTESDIDLMVQCLCKFDPEFPVNIQQMALEFIDKYYLDPVQEILMMVADRDVTMMYEYFKYGPYVKNYDDDLMKRCVERAFKCFKVYDLPKYLSVNRPCAMIDGTENYYDGLQLLIPYSNSLSNMTSDEFNNFRKSVHDILCTMNTLKIFVFSDMCGPIVSERLFSYSNFDLILWENGSNYGKDKFKKPKKLPQKKSRAQEIVDDLSE